MGNVQKASLVLVLAGLYSSFRERQKFSPPAEQRDLISFCVKKVVEKAKRPISESEHVLSCQFTADSTGPTFSLSAIRPRNANGSLAKRLLHYFKHDNL